MCICERLHHLLCDSKKKVRLHIGKAVSTVGFVYGRGSTREDPARLFCSLRMDVQFESRDRSSWT